MSDQTRQSPSIDEFLVAVSSRDLQGDFVFPKPDVEERLTQEVAHRTGSKSRNMAEEKGLETVQYWISAKPYHFVAETKRAVDNVCLLLGQKGSKAFELIFHNTKQSPNEWGKQVLFAVRYDRGL